MIEIFHTLFKYKEKESPDKIGAFPERVHVEALPERRYLWTSRILVMFSVISICFNMMLACTIYLLLPQISVYPRFFRINDYFHQIELVQKREIMVPVSDVITEKYIYEYMNLRYTISDNPLEMERRWRTGSAFYWYQTANVYSDFLSTEYNSFMNRAKKYNMQRYIDIEWIKALSTGLIQVQFKTYDFLPDNPNPEITYWRATMRALYANLRFADRTNRALNPYGFLISDYSLSYHGREGDTESYIETARKRSLGK